MKGLPFILSAAMGAATVALAAGPALPGAGAARTAPGDAEVLAELTSLTQQVQDCIRDGDREVLERLGAADMLLVNRDGKAYTKAEFVGDLVKPRPGYELELKVAEPRMVRRGDAAVFTFVTDERLKIYGHDMSTLYRSTAVWFREGEGWKLGLYMYLETPVDPRVVPLPPAALAAFEGTYEIAPGAWVTRVYLEDGKLMAQRDQSTPREIKPFGPDRFFYPGVEGELLFSRDASGRVTGMAFRRNFKDLPYRRIR